MLTISLHGIHLHAPIGLYPEEKVRGNDFEVDLDLFVSAFPASSLPFLDYAIAYNIVEKAFRQKGELMELFLELIHQELRAAFPQADKIRVSIRKLNPSLKGGVRYAQVTLEK